jgi:hypothetical protein
MKLHASYQDAYEVYLLTEALLGGDMFSALSGYDATGTCMPIEHARFYAACVTRAPSRVPAHRSNVRSCH